MAGKLLGALLATGVVLAPLLIAGAAAGALSPPPAHWPALLALLALTSVMASGLGLLIGLAARSPRVVMMLSLNTAIVLFFLGGGFTTVAFMPEWLQTLSLVVPTSYAIEALRQVLFYPDLVGFGRDMLAIGAFAAAAAGLGTVGLARSLGRP